MVPSQTLSSFLFICLLCCCVSCGAFSTASKARIASNRSRFSLQRRPCDNEIRCVSTTSATLLNQNDHKRLSPSALCMYNLPPSGGGGGGGGNNGLKEILASVGTLALIVAFFASPLGGLFFAVLNSFFVLSLVVPVLLWVAFQGWQFLNTVEGPCPQCGAPVRVLKENETPSICLNCGTFVQATPDKSGVEFYREEDQVIVDEGYTSSIWDSLLSGPMGARSAPTTRSAKERESQFRREATIIDVEVDDKDYKQ